MGKSAALLIILVLLVACTPPPSSTTPAFTQNATPAAATTPTPTSPPPSPTTTPPPTHTPTPTATPTPIQGSISPSLDEARAEGFHQLAGHPPFNVDFSAEVKGGCGTLLRAWDFDGNGTPDSDAVDPTPFTYQASGEYTATLTISDACGQEIQAQQRIVVIGEPKWPAWRYGVTAHLNRNAGLYATHDEIERAVQMITEIGIQVVRLDLTWDTIQPTDKDSYWWEDYDYLVILSTQYDFDLLPIIGYSARWASSAPDAPERSEWLFAAPPPADYAWFAYQAAERYKGHIHAWQVWNEPNLSFFWRPEPDPAAYAELLRHAYLAIKYADPDAAVILAGLANDGSADVPEYVWYPPERFLQAIYDAGAGPYFDAVARHPYTSPYAGTGSLLRKLNALHQVVVANGDAQKPIWLTETGYSALRATGVTDRLQGRWLTRSIDAALSLEYVPVVFWYNFRETGNDARDWEHHYGLIEQDWTIKPAYEAYRETIATHP